MNYSYCKEVTLEGFELNGRDLSWSRPEEQICYLKSNSPPHATILHYTCWDSPDEIKIDTLSPSRLIQAETHSVLSPWPAFLYMLYPGKVLDRIDISPTGVAATRRVPWSRLKFSLNSPPSIYSLFRFFNEIKSIQTLLPDIFHNLPCHYRSTCIKYHSRVFQASIPIPENIEFHQSQHNETTNRMLSHY